MNLLKKVQHEFKTDYFSVEMLDSLLPNKSTNAKHSLLKRLCANGELIRMKNGFYVINNDDQRYGFSKFMIANFLFRPSYISMESALSHYGLIPEAVYVTTSVTAKKKNEYETPLGNFLYSHLKIDYYNFGYYQSSPDSGTKESTVKNGILIATPLKALMDYIILMNKNYSSLKNIEDDLRFDFDEFFTYKNFVNIERVNEYKERYKTFRVKRILTAIGRQL